MTLQVIDGLYYDEAGELIEYPGRTWQCHNPDREMCPRFRHYVMAAGKDSNKYRGQQCRECFYDEFREFNNPFWRCEGDYARKN